MYVIGITAFESPLDRSFLQIFMHEAINHPPPRPYVCKKVFKGLWRGTVVAVKSMVLPANMSGTERREKMAIMEAAISSALSHPNIVQVRYILAFFLRRVAPGPWILFPFRPHDYLPKSHLPTHTDLHLQPRACNG